MCTRRIKALIDILQLPVDYTTLTEEEKLIRLARRKPKQKIVIEEDIEDSFDASEYKFLWNKKWYLRLPNWIVSCG